MTAEVQTKEKVFENNTEQEKVGTETPNELVINIDKIEENSSNPVESTRKVANKMFDKLEKFGKTVEGK